MQEIEIELQIRNFWKGISLGLCCFSAAMIWLCITLYGNASANKDAYRELEQVARKVALGYIAERVNEQPSSFDEAVKRFVVQGDSREDGTRILVSEDAISGIILNPLPSENYGSHKLPLPCGKLKKSLSGTCAHTNLFFLLHPFCDCDSAKQKCDNQAGTGDCDLSDGETDHTRDKERDRNAHAIRDGNTSEQQSFGI